MSKEKTINLDEISLYEISKSYKEQDVIGDYRHPMWQRYATIAMKELMKNPNFRMYGLQLSNMVKNNKINGVILSTIVEDMSSQNISEKDKEALKIIAAIKNM